MTENNAIERCDMLINGLSMDNSTNNAFKEEGKDYPTFATMKEFAKTCKKALEKVQAFEEIGTVEEFKALKEKLQGYKNQMSIYAEQHKVILASDVLDLLEELDWSE